jgi:DNA gyrase subunit B
MRELAYLNRGIKITLTDHREQIRDEVTGATRPLSRVFYSEGGLKEFVKYLDQSRESISGEVVYFEGIDDENMYPVEVALQYNTSYTENIHSYVNNINTHEGGTHVSGFKSALTRTLKKYADNSGLLNKIKFEISGEDFREGLTVIISVKVPEL